MATSTPTQKISLAGKKNGMLPIPGIDAIEVSGRWVTVQSKQYHDYTIPQETEGTPPSWY